MNNEMHNYGPHGGGSGPSLYTYPAAAANPYMQVAIKIYFVLYHQIKI